MQIREPYPDDLLDQEWDLIAPLVTFKTTRRGRKGFHPKREMLNAIFYLLRTGCQWRHLPHDLPPWKSVYTQFRRWRLAGLFEMIHDHLRKELRVLLKRARAPSAGIVDSQSVQITEKGGFMGMMESRKLTGGRGILLLIPRASF
jgi:transposase